MNRPRAVAHHSPTTWPLIGRAAELERIEAVRRTREVPGVVLLGAAGVGKSRLAREALGAAAADGAMVEWVQATRSAATVPLAAFADLLDPDPPADDPLGVMRRLSEALRVRAGGRRLVVGVDDAQLLDAASASLVAHLAKGGVAFVVATVRSGEPCPDAIVSLWKDAGAERITVGDLGEDETARLAETALGGAVSQGARDWLHRMSAGNALFLSELVRGAVESGTLETRDGLWRLGETNTAVSASLRDLIEGRMTGLSYEQRALLEILALGEPLPLDELTAFGDTALVAALEEDSMIAVRSARGRSSAALAHPLYGEVLRSSMPVMRGRTARVRLAEAMLRRGALRRDESLRAATWLLEAGEPAPRALLLEATRAALGAGDPDTGEWFASSAIEAGAGPEAVIELARAHVARRRFEEADGLLEPLEGRLETHDLAMDHLELRASYLYWNRRDPEALRALLVRARGWHDGPDWARRVASLELRFAAIADIQAGSPEDVAALLVDPAMDEALRRRVEAAHAVRLFLDGRVTEACDLARGALPPVPLIDQAARVAFASWVLIAAEAGADHAELEASLSRFLTAAVRADDHVAAGLSALGLGAIGHLQGRLHDAARWLAEADLHFEYGDVFGSEAITRALQVCVAHLAGDRERTARALARCERSLGGAAPLPVQLPYVVRARAWARAGEGHVDEAAVALLRAAAGASDWPVYAVGLAYDSMRAGERPRTAWAGVEAVAGRADGPLTRACVADMRARAARDPAAILEAVDALEGAGALVYAREAALAAAVLHRVAGRDDSARRALARARALHALGQGGEPPHLEGLEGPAIGLTRREEQLVVLASRGLSNAEIAEQLVLSVRTVESHMYRAMRKLGVSDRRDLAAHLPGGPEE